MSRYRFKSWVAGSFPVVVICCCGIIKEGSLRRHLSPASALEYLVLISPERTVDSNLFALGLIKMVALTYLNILSTGNKIAVLLLSIAGIFCILGYREIPVIFDRILTDVIQKGKYNVIILIIS